MNPPVNPPVNPKGKAMANATSTKSELHYADYASRLQQVLASADWLDDLRQQPFDYVHKP